MLLIPDFVIVNTSFEKVGVNAPFELVVMSEELKLSGEMVLSLLNEKFEIC